MCVFVCAAAPCGAKDWKRFRSNIKIKTKRILLHVNGCRIIFATVKARMSGLINRLINNKHDFALGNSTLKLQVAQFENF